MSFKIKNSQLSNETLAVLTQLIDMDINATAAFKLSRIIKVISSVTEDKLKMEKKIYEKWVSRDENGNPIVPLDKDGNKMKGSVSISDVDSFSKEMKELMDTETEVPYDKINFEDLKLQNTVKVKDMIKIEFLFLD
jgi:hypothetical protein